MSNRENAPHPSVLHVCTSRVNHSLQFSAVDRGEKVYIELLEAKDAFNKARASNPAATGLHSIVDDFGTMCTVDLGDVFSFRVTNTMAEHRAAGLLKLAEFYAALEFQEVADRDHPALKILRAQQQKAPIIRPQ